MIPAATRPWLLRAHRWTGLLLAAFLASSGLTGAVIVFDEAIDARLNPDLYDAPAAAPGAVPLSPQSLVARLEAQLPQAQVRYLIHRPAPGRTVHAFVGPRPGATLAVDEVFADPVTGRVLGARRYGACCLSRRALIPFIYRFHANLVLGDLGQWLLGGVAVLWTLDCVNGLLLTLPGPAAARHGTAWKQWRLAWTIGLHRGGIRRIFDLHRAVSLWLWVALLGIAISGISLTLPRSFDAVVRHTLPMAADPPPAPPDTAPARSTVPSIDRAQDLAVQAARAAGWRGGPPQALYIAGDTTTFYFSQDDSVHGRGLGAWTVGIDASGHARLTRPGTGRAGDLVEALQMPWHDGRLIGLPGRILIALSGVATAMLSVTGVLIWWRKRAARLSMRRRRPAHAPEAGFRCGSRVRRHPAPPRASSR